MVRINDNCTGCGRCIVDCISDAIMIKDGRAKAVRPCIACGHCYAICPVKAPVLSGVDMEDVEEINPAAFVDSKALLHTIKGRRSIRKYQERSIEEDKLDLLFEAGRYTATAVNYQDLRFIVVQERLAEFKELIWNGVAEMAKSPEKYPDIERYAGHLKKKAENPADDYLFRNAPAIIFVVTDRPVDAGMAAQNMELAAVAQGLGVMYNGYMVRAANMVPGAAEWLQTMGRPVSACMLAGYPAVTYLRSAPRKEADVIRK